MTRSRRGRWAPIARGMLVLALMLTAVLLPLAAMAQSPRESVAQSAGQDSLWAAGEKTQGLNLPSTAIAACADPASPAALDTCFASFTATETDTSDWVAGDTDGVNVYFVHEYTGVQEYGGLSCPVADLGANCTQIMAGGWDGGRVLSIAARGGYLWLGQTTGQIYRCPANLPYADQDTMPSQCVLLDDAGNRGVWSLLLANGRLYAGLSQVESYVYQNSKDYGLLWSCDPYAQNACSELDRYGDTKAYSLVAGAGYLWAGLENGVIWRCDLTAENACTTWDKAGNEVNMLSSDGQGTLYAAIRSTSTKHPDGVIWSCPTVDENSCGNVLSSVDGWWVAAGAGSVFSSVSTGMYFGTSPFTAADQAWWGDSLLLYIPADGPAGVGGVEVTMTAKALGKKLEKRCDKPGRTARATVTVTGPSGFRKTLKTGACGLLNGGIAKATLDLLDPGQYTVKATAGSRSGKASFTIEQDRTKPVNVKLTRGSTGR